jgi:hypothetical protein
VDLLGADSATINAPDVNPVENRQHHGAGPHQEGGRPQGKGSPRGRRKDPPSRPPASTASAASIHPLRRERPGRCSLQVPVNHGLAPRPQCFSPDINSQGSPPDRSLCLSPIGADEMLLFLERRRRPGSHRRTQLEVGLQAGLPLSSHSPPQEGYQEAGTVQGDVSPCHPVLRRPDVVCLSPSATRGRRSPPSVQRRPRPDLERLFLVVWTISVAIGESTPSQTDPSVSSRQDESNPQKTAMKEHGSPLRPSSALPPFHSIRCL